MTKDPIFRKLGHILERHFLVMPGAIKPQRTFSDLGMSPYDRLEALNHVEREFAITINQEEEQNLYTIGQAISTIHHHLHHG